MNKKTTLIIVLQAIIIVALFWVLVFYAKDEFEAFHGEEGETEEHENGQEEGIKGLNRVTSNEGINIVSLSPASQQNSGITTAKVSSVRFQGEIKSYGNVVAIDSLSDAKSRYISLKSDIGITQSANTNNLQQYQRLKALNADDKNVSDQALQAALADVQADSARIGANQLQLKNLQANTKLQWGEQLAKLAFEDKLPPALADLLTRKNVLIQISLPLSANTPKQGDSVTVTPLNESATPIKAIYVSPATQTDTSFLGKTFYYSASANLLRIGMRVNVAVEQTNDSANGAVIPSNAVIWYAGKAWAYFKNGQDTNVAKFSRKPISTDTEVDDGWFNKDIDENSEVVVSGAQLLLSEEFKYQIKNENED